jgi:predicted Zn-dependent protease
MSHPILNRRFHTHALRLLAIALLVAQFLAGPISTANAQQQRIPVVRDAEIEALVREYARPILAAAGLSKSGVDIILVNDRAFNAFVAGRRMFINTGALLIAETPNEIIGVIAHEAGHIAGGHQERLREQLARAQTMAVVASLLGMGATIGGALTDNSGLAQSGAGIAMGGTEMARRGLLGYQRTEETTADRSALVYLEKTGQSARGMLKTFERFASALALTGSRVDPYQVSHPMPRERIANLDTLARASPHFGKADSPALQLRHDLMRAKIAAFTEGPSATSRLFRNDPHGLPARYADAINTYLRGRPADALRKADDLLKTQPNNAYFHELRADILLRANKPADAARAYQNAMKLDPSKSAVIQIGYGRTLLAAGDPESIKRAVRELRAALDRDRENADGYLHLAQAYGRAGDVAEAELATAEMHYYSGAIQDARIFATRAQQKFKRGSPSWLRAQDIINQRPPRKN